MSKKNSGQSKKDNFNQAMFEMFGVGREPVVDEVEENVPEGFVPAAPSIAEPLVEPAPESSVPVSEPPRRKDLTYFAEGTSLEGTLRCGGDVEICGNFKGNLFSEGKATLHSSAASNVTASELALIDCTLTGDVTVSRTISINENSTIVGNVAAANLICSGVIRGSMVISGNITLTESAQVFGDIKTDTLAISRGAKVSGKIEMGLDQ